MAVLTLEQCYGVGALFALNLVWLGGSQRFQMRKNLDQNIIVSDLFAIFLAYGKGNIEDQHPQMSQVVLRMTRAKKNS